MNGNLVYVVGASGAGKDSLLRYARRRLDGRAPVYFAPRYITRPAEAGGENHVEVSENEFAMMKRHGAFALDWGSHGLFYGIGTEIRAWLEQEGTVVINGSRAYLEEATQRFGECLQVVQICVSTEVLRQRLQERARETAQQREERLQRASAFSVHHPRLTTLDNGGPLEEAGERLLALLTQRYDVNRPLEATLSL